MPTPAMAHEIFIAAAVPNLNAAQPSLMDGNNNLADTPPATGLLAPAQAPSGSVTGQSATFNFVNTITSTKEYLHNILNVESAQQGTNAISNVVSITASFAGIPSKDLMVNNYTAGSVGTAGNKFS